MSFNDNCNSKAIVLGMSCDGEKICSAAGRISTQQGTSIDIWNKSADTEKNSSLIKKVTRSGHNSVVEHTFFNIAFCDVTAVTEQFMIEFRLASFTVKSRRYVDFSNVGYFVPEFKNKENEQKYREHIDYLFAEYQYFLDNGIAKEDARFLLPYCYRSNFYCSLNARELLHVLRAMVFGRGSKFPEIYNLGKQILEQVQPMCPGIFADFESKVPTKSDTMDLSDFKTEIDENEPTDLVELLAYTDNAEDTICIASLVNNLQISSEQASKIIEDESKAEEIIKRIFACSRPRELETIQYTFRYNRLSLASITHLVRHRMQGVMIPPLTSVNRKIHITPDAVKNNAELLERYNNAFERNAEVYNMLKTDGESEEALVYLVLSGNTLDVITTMNGRELMLYFRLRTCTRAQWEIRDYACEALRKLREIEPMIFKNYGPSCYVEGKCPEGALTCGRAVEMKELFSK